MSALEVFKSKASALSKISDARETARITVNGIEIIVGAGASGYVAKTIGSVGGIPADAAIGLLALGIGMGMRQRDITALGVGFLAGYARDFGSSLAAPAVPVL